MRAIFTITIVLMLSTLNQAQNSVMPRQAPDEAYTEQLVRLLAGLQKNPWLGWTTGTEVVVRYLDDKSPTSTTRAQVQPDLIYEIKEADKLLIRKQTVKGKTALQEFLIKDQTGLEASSIKVKEATPADVEIDGITLSAVISELRIEEFPGGSRITKEWALDGHPSILLRQEVNGAGWRVTSARVIRKIGEREFQCVEIKKRMRIYSDGQIDVTTTQYLSPDVPGHLVEQIDEFVKVKNQGKQIPYMIVHQKVVELKFK